MPFSSRVLRFVSLVALLSSAPTFAGVFYVDGSAGNDSNSGTQSAPKKTLQSGIALMSSSGGDVLTIQPGTYSGSGNSLSSPKNGTAGAWNVIKAATDGTVTITTGLDIGTGNHYVQFEGLKFSDSGIKTILGGYTKFMRTAFRGGPSSGNVVSVQIGSNDMTPGADHVLLEDSWVYGQGGRYKILVYNSTNIVLRRVVTRFDGGYNNTDGAPEADITVYDSQNVAVLNAIAIDGISGRGAYVAAFYNALNGTTSTPNNNREWRGSMTINPTGYFMGTEGQVSITNLKVIDCASYGGTFGVSQLKGTNNLYQRLTLVNSGGDGFGIFGGSATVQDSVVAAPRGSAFNGVSASNSLSLSTVTSLISDGVKYLPRVESGSLLSLGGLLGGQRGANIMKRLGASGTLYGETNYNAETSEDLWPWPYEARIKADFAEESTRGFAGSSGSMTDYIWGLLGNGSPVAQAPVPNAPTNVVAE
jgi:hypothetical protein